MMALHRWEILSRPECSLCDIMLMELTELLGDQISQVQVRDISNDVDLERRYGKRIPVLLIDDECVCTYKLDRDKISAYLA